MTTAARPAAIEPARATTTGRGRAIALGVARFATIGVMLAGALPKFVFAEDGARQLATALGLGRLEITGLGLVELSAAILLLFAATRGVGALLAVGMMAGALISHVTTLGWSGSAPAEMWPLALVALVGGSITLVANRRSLPLIGDRL